MRCGSLLYIGVCALSCCVLTLDRAYSGWAFVMAGKSQWNNDGEYSEDITPRLQFKEDEFYAHVEWCRPFEPQDKDGELEVQNEYSLTAFSNSEFTLKHELYYDFDQEEYAAELTPKLYTQLSKKMKIGFELEIDYLQHNAFDLFELEVEPTIKWQDSFGPGKLKLELEAPVMRLYSSNDSRKDFEFETVEFIGVYSLSLNKTTTLSFKLELPYDLQQNELETEVDIYFSLDF